MSIAEEIALNTSALSTTLAKALLSHPQEDPQSTHLIDSKCIFWCFQHQDFVEGATSFLEKRLPHFPLKVSKDLPDFYPWWKEPKVAISKL